MTQLFDLKTLSRQRNRNAGNYFRDTELPELIEKELVERLGILTLNPSRVLVLGAVATSTLQTMCDLFPQAHFTVLDCSGNMLGGLAQLQGPRVTLRQSQDWAVDSDGVRFDLVFSSFYLPFCDDLNAFFTMLHQVIRADGCFHFSSLGPDTFAELHAAWARADADNVYHTLISPDMHDVGDALVHAGFREPVMDRENYTLTYSSTEALFGDLRNHGVSNGFVDRHKGLTGKSLWNRFSSALAKDPDTDRYALTVEVVIGQAWRGDGMSQQKRPDGAVGISLEALAHKLRSEQGDDI